MNLAYVCIYNFKEKCNKIIYELVEDENRSQETL